jgi:hypothetical protein
VWHPLNKESRAVVALRILQCCIQNSVEVPLNGWKVGQEAIASISVTLLQLPNHIILRQEMDRALVLPMHARQTGKFWEAFQS